MNQKYVYIVFSATPYRIGKMIRSFTKDAYNHASISLDEDLSRMYGFARRYCNVPLYGGFVKESTSRFQPKGINSSVKIHRIPVTEEAYRSLEARFDTMYQHREDYLYNHFSFLAVPLKKPIHVRDAYTCLEFCVEVMHSIGLDVTPGKYYSIHDILTFLEPYTLYEGPMPQNSEYDADFFAKKPIPYPTLTSVKCILDLVPRMK